MADRFPLILNTSANQIQEIASGDQLDLSGNNIANAGIITASSFSGPVVASGIITAVAADIDDFVDVGSNIQLGNAGVITATTFKGDGDFVELDVDGHTNLDNVSVAGVSTFANDVIFDNALKILYDTSNSFFRFGDNVKAGFGNNGDLEIYHNATNSYIDNNTGDLHLQTTGSGDDIFIESADDFFLKVNGSDTAIQAYGGAYTELRWNNEAKIRTNNEGVEVLDSTSTQSMVKMNTSGGQAGALYGVGDNVIALLAGNLQWVIKGNKGGATELYHTGNAKKLETTTTGITVTGNVVSTGNATVSGNLSVGGVLTYEDVTNIDSVGIITARSSIKLDADGSSSSNFLSIGADDDLKIFHQSNVDKIESSANGLHIRQINNGDLHIHAGANTGSSNNRFVARAAGAAELYHSGTKKLETRSNGITVTGYTYSDGVTIGNGTAYKYLAGSGNQLQMYHTGSSGNGYILNTQGTLLIGGPVVSFTNQANNAFLIRAVDGGTAELYFNSNKKLETTNTGVTVTGTLAATAVTGDGSGLTNISVGLSTEQVTPSSNVATLDLTKDDHKIVASGTYTITCTGGTEAENHTLRIENSGTANVGFSSYFKFPSGGTPSLPTTNGAISLISFTVHKVGSVGIATVLLSGASVNYS